MGSVGSEARFRGLLDRLNAGVFRAAPDGRLHECSRSVPRLLGVASADEVGSLRDYGIELGWAAEEPAGPDSAHVREWAVRLRRADGCFLWVSVRAAPCRDPADGALAVEGLLEDITERRATERALLASTEHNRVVAQTLPDPLIQVDADQRIAQVNDAAERTFGHPRAAMVGQPLDLLLVRGACGAPLQDVGTACESGSGGPARLFEVLGQHASGRRIPLQVACARAPGRFGGAPSWTLVLRDISERRKAEETLRLVAEGTATVTGEDFFRCLVEHLAAALGAKAAFVSEACERCAGCCRILALWDGDQRVEPFEADIDGALWGERALVFHPREVPRLFPDDRLLRELGAESLLALPLVDAAGEVIGQLGVLDDKAMPDAPPELSVLRIFAARAGAELDRLRAAEALRLSDAQLRQAQKMEAVGRLAGGVAHDFNNLLTAMMAFSGLISSRIPAGDPLRDVADQMLRSADRAAALTRQLLLFSRKDMGEPRVLDLNEVLADLELMLRRILGEDVALQVEPGARLGRIKTDPGQLEQVVVNLVVNGRDAMAGGGRVRLGTADVDLDPEAALRLGGEAGRYVLLEVADGGCGMDPETLARIFEPFFTTKPEGCGTGLGLSTVYAIVRQAGGFIDVQSEPGRGSTFRVFLPRVEEPLPGPRAGIEALEPPKGTETILLVEDEPTVRVMVRETLARLGYTVLEAEDGRSALRASACHGGSIELLVTDLVMPQMSGFDLAQRLAPLRPGMRVLYMSGYPDQQLAPAETAGLRIAFMAKPFTGEALARKVRALLADADAAGPPPPRRRTRAAGWR